jgi:hypothetical protein
MGTGHSPQRADRLQQPECPTCRDTAFVRQEQVITGGKAISYWTCSSCLRSWPAPAPRMLKADLKPRE